MSDIEANKASIGDARLWDPNVLKEVYTEIQRGGRSIYQFGDADIIALRSSSLVDFQ